MRPRRRDITVFSLSLMDMICGALGVFVILVLLLMIDSNHAHGEVREKEALVEEAKANMATMKQDLEGQLKSLQGELAGARSTGEAAERRIAELEGKLQRLKRKGSGGGGKKVMFTLWGGGGVYFLVDNKKQGDRWKTYYKCRRHSSWIIEGGGGTPVSPMGPVGK